MSTFQLTACCELCVYASISCFSYWVWLCVYIHVCVYVRVQIFCGVNSYHLHMLYSRSCTLPECSVAGAMCIIILWITCIAQCSLLFTINNNFVAAWLSGTWEQNITLRYSNFIWSALNDWMSFIHGSEVRIINVINKNWQATLHGLNKGVGVVTG